MNLMPDLFNSPEWWPVAVGIVVVTALLVAWSYMNSTASVPFRLLLAGLKLSGVALLALCLLEPMRSETKPETGANLFVVAADASRSMNVRDRLGKPSRADRVSDLLNSSNQWLLNLESEFDLRRYQFGERLNSVQDYSDYAAEANGSSIDQVVQVIGNRYQNRPLAGVLLLTDGNSTASLPSDLSWDSMPPIYPVVMGSQRPARDLEIVNTTVSESNFETAPVTIAADLICHGMGGSTIEVQLLDHESKEIERKKIARVEDNRKFAVRFQVKPQQRGVSTFTLRAFAEGNEELVSESEATVFNNQRQLIVNHRSGPYRILYVTGRPNWEYKFLRRALSIDDEIELVGLMRLAKREAKFTFRGHEGESTNSLYRGFGNQGDQTAEQYDEPVMVRLDVKDNDELRGGFPKAASELFKFHAIILDDVEASFFSEDQKTLIQDFVESRGGGLLMLGGQESFVKGEFDRTPIGEMLPVYVDRFQPSPQSANYQMSLTREGWLQPWIRVRSTQGLEQQRLSEMPPFKTINRVNSIKPGAAVLASVRTEDGENLPALVTQRFGKGRTGALLLGDYWRWHLNAEPGNEDLLISWRQMMRWLVSETPQRIEAELVPADNANLTHIEVAAYDDQYRLLNNADVKVKVGLPDGQSLELPTDPIDGQSGAYRASFASRDQGLYRVSATVQAPDEDSISSSDVGWVASPQDEEFASIIPNRSLLETLASKTGGEVIEANQLNQFVNSLGNRPIPYVETVTHPWWHSWQILLLALGLLVAEWGLRRWKGMA